MTFQDLGSLGELVGGIAVVVSVVYLAIQIRHNTRGLDQNRDLMRMSFENEIRRDAMEFRSTIVADAELAEIWRRGLAGDADFNPVEKVRFHLLMVSIVDMLRAQFDAQGRGIFATSRGEFLRGVVSMRGFREWWVRLGESKSSSSDFVEYVNSLPSRRESGPNS
jgi:hypothetical protein